MTVTAPSSAPDREQTGATVELSGLHRRFGATQALDGFTLTLQPGELVALLGPSGCGKTTALRVLAGFETVDRGRVLVDGVDQSRIPAQRRDMGMVFQSYSLFPNMTARDNVAFGLRIRKVAAARRRERALEILELVGLEGEADKFPHQMSGGQQQRVALARALAIEPRVLLLDEPLSALDAKVRVQLREQIRVLQTRLKITTLFVTHDQEEALSMADRVCVMRSGRIEQVDVPATLYAAPATPFVAEFVGTMNRIPGVITDGGVSLLEVTVAVRTPKGTALTERAPGTPVDVLVRPEGLAVAASPGGRGIVMTTTFLGSVTRLGVLLDEDVMVYVDQPNSAVPVPVGSAAEVSLRERAVMVADPTGRSGASAGGAGQPFPAEGHRRSS
ncbi:MAG TPA: ABC transporter ATP-binding protein [Acidimicrobiales bacterium]|jgi:putative spermidine/putrescine transport system ATP-binding protein|nr:ABC transporter ATP-binding protein [Acidimicrobiales bacterium]